jgi:hypothetical protein
MRRHQPQDSHFDEIDEHDAPTEPMMPIAIAPFLRTQAGSTDQPAQYPYLPPAQVKRNGHGRQRPPGGAPPSAASPVYPVLAARPAKQAQPKRSTIPTFVGTFFVIVQLLLLMRFLLKLMSMPGNGGWVSIVYTISGLFVFPFRLLLQNMALSLPVSVEVFTLLAILVYGLFSRILVRFLKALLNSR